MSQLPEHPMESAIVEALTEGLDRLPVSLPPTKDVLAAAGEPGVPTPSPAAVAGVAEFVDRAERPGRGWFGFLSHRWPYAAGAVLVLAATIGIAAGIQLHQGTQGPATSSRPPAPAPSGGGGSQPVGGVPSSTPLPTSTPSPELIASPPPTMVPTPPPRTPIPAPRRQSTPVPAMPATPATPVPASTSSAPPPTTAPPSTSPPTPAATPAATPSATPSPRPRRCLLILCVP